ncbi:MAG: LppX_LprAFG lipoprotein [Nocardiopsaceae bacterium]|jgi:hypothetical protein|nr:LppX_LprAFG lipoprotein [Nocardiopsaceae bacterium]
MTAKKAILTAASQARKVTSAVELLTIRGSGVQSETTSGFVQFRLTPTLLIGEKLNLAAAGKSTQIKAVLTDQAFYLNEPTLAKKLGKPWMRVDLSALKKTPLGGITQLIHGLQDNNFLNQTQLFTAAKDVRIVGKQTVDGVPTTEYAGSFHAADALKVLSPTYRKALAPGLKLLGNIPISFHIWIDGQHQVRKATEVETINGETINITVLVKAINQPVHVTIPSRSQTVTPPGL